MYGPAGRSEHKVEITHKRDVSLVETGLGCLLFVVIFMAVYLLLWVVGHVSELSAWLLYLIRVPQ